MLEEQEFSTFLQDMTALVLKKLPNRTEPVRVPLPHHYSFEGWVHSHMHAEASPLIAMQPFKTLVSSSTSFDSKGMCYKVGIAWNDPPPPGVEFTALICEVSSLETVVTRWSIYLGETDHLSLKNVVETLQDDVLALITKVEEKIEAAIQKKTAGSHDQSGFQGI